MNSELYDLLQQRNQELETLSPDDPDYDRIRAHRDAIVACLPLMGAEPGGWRHGAGILLTMALLLAVIVGGLAYLGAFA